MRYLSMAASLAAAWLISACGGGGGNSAEPGLAVSSTTQSVNTAGGTVALQGLSLTLPAAALTESVQVGVQQETVASPALARFRFSPAGQTLKTPAELRYSAAGLPANVRFFWEVNGEQWMVPGTVSAGTLTSSITTLGFNAAGTSLRAQAASLTARAKAASARALPLSESGGEGVGGGVVVLPVDCDVHITELKARLVRAATEGDQIRAAAIFNDLQATRFAVMAMDAAVVQTDTMTLLPGVIAKNTTVLVSRDANAEEGQAQLVKQGVGLVFSMSSSRADGPAQAARNMVELSTVELVGRLIKAPYWQCLGIPDTDPEVQRELDDWFLSMEEGERIQFYKQRMREGRYYNGAIDAQTDAAFQSALRDYRLAMGLPKQGPMDEAFFRQLVTQAVPRKGSVPTPSPNGQPMSLTLLGNPTQGKPSTKLELRMNTPGYVYCYSQDEATGRIQRIFPNRFQPDPRLNPGKPLSLPGKASFQLNPSAQHACIHAPQEVYADLPPQLRWGDFEDIRLNSFEEIRQQFAQASGMKVVLVEQVGGRR
jgi:hypothetical protein